MKSACNYIEATMMSNNEEDDLTRKIEIQRQLKDDSVPIFPIEQQFKRKSYFPPHSSFYFSGNDDAYHTN